MLHALIEEVPIAVLSVDVDQLKSINDRGGTPAGDEALSHTARTIRQCFNEPAVVARNADDEFVVLLETNDAEALENAAGQLCQAVEQQSQNGSGSERVTVSVGGVLCAMDAGLPLVKSQIFCLADQAMDQSKRAGGNRATILKWDSDQNGPATSRQPAQSQAATT